MNDTATSREMTGHQTMPPRLRYQDQIQRGELAAEPAQAEIIDHLNRLFGQLTAEKKPPKRLFPWQKATQTPPQGIYLWGGVGRGKTWLMDLFFHSLPFEQKLRLHFHRFMRRIHHELEQLKGQPDPLEIVAAQLAREARVICLDEFHVSDIGDAMLLGQLLKGLFHQGVTLVTTSNIPPDELYKDGLQRANFLPAIALLHRHTQVLQLKGDTDYRLHHLEQAAVYHSPLDGQTAQRMRTEFLALAPDIFKEETFIRIEGRAVPARARADDVIWFDFGVICGSPRSPADYIEIARCFHAVLVSDIPLLDDYQGDRLRRFMHLVDELYDRNVKLVLSAEAEPESLYHGSRLAFEFQRTISRLREMQSHTYLAREHRPG